jgi:hypothetical protein
MRSNIVILLVMAAYFTVADIAYAIWTHIDTGAVEPIGTAAIGLLVVLSTWMERLKKEPVRLASSHHGAGGLYS